MTYQTYGTESHHTMGHDEAVTSAGRVDRHCAKIVSHVSEGRALWDSDFGGIIDTMRSLIAERDALKADVMKLLEENERLRVALSEQSMPCTCHEAYAGRKMQDPGCKAGEYGDDLREAIGLPPLCQYNLRRPGLKGEQP